MEMQPQDWSETIKISSRLSQWTSTVLSYSSERKFEVNTIKIMLQSSYELWTTCLLQLVKRPHTSASGHRGLQWLDIWTIFAKVTGPEKISPIEMRETFTGILRHRTPLLPWRVREDAWGGKSRHVGQHRCPSISGTVPGEVRSGGRDEPTSAKRERKGTRGGAPPKAWERVSLCILTTSTEAIPGYYHIP